VDPLGCYWQVEENLRVLFWKERFVDSKSCLLPLFVHELAAHTVGPREVTNGVSIGQGLSGQVLTLVWMKSLGHAPCGTL